VGSEIIVILEERLKNFFAGVVSNRSVTSKRDAEKLEKIQEFIQGFRTLPFPEEATKFLLEEVPVNLYRAREEYAKLGEKFEQQFGNTQIRG